MNNDDDDCKLMFTDGLSANSLRRLFIYISRRGSKVLVYLGAQERVILQVIFFQILVLCFSSVNYASV